jgi:hypothetical protein
VVRYCRNSSVLSALSAFLAVFQCARVSSFSVSVQFFKLTVIFTPMMSVKKTDCPLLQKGVKRTRKTKILETQILVIGKTEAGEKREL